MKYRKRFRPVLMTALTAALTAGVSVPAFADTVMKAPSVTAEFTNLQTKLRWKKIKGAEYYRVYRKASASGTYKQIASVKASDADSFTYTDHYYQTLTKGPGSSLLDSGAYVDPSENSLRYTVKAVRTKTSSSGKKTVVSGAYKKDGVFHLEAPAVTKVSVSVSGDTVTDKITFGTVPNAEGYILYSGRKGESGETLWTRIKKVRAVSAVTQTVSAKVNADDDYVTVKAFAARDGKYVYSGFDRNFTTEDRNYQGEKILYLGDSISYGTPYLEKGERHIFSFPYRVAQITGSSYYNPSISGATIAYNKQLYRSKGTYSIYQHLALPISRGNSPSMPAYLHNTKKKSFFSDYDVVVIQAGTNDYQFNIRTGNASSTDITTVSGALNQTMKLIEQGSKARIRQGKTPIKVVVPDLFYSERYGTVRYKRINRFKQKNRLGLTLTAYQKAIDKVLKKYSGKTDISIYSFATSDYLNASNIRYASADNLHMTKYTAGQFGTAFANFLIGNVFDD